METNLVIVVRKYGLLSPLNWDKDVTDELFRANKFWNSLVEIERENRAEYHRIMSQSSAMAEVSEAIASLKKDRDELLAERAHRRAAARSKTKADTAALDSRIKGITAELRPLYLRTKELKAQAKQEQKPLLDTLEEQRRSKIKEARQQSGCFWSNYNAVLDSFNVARAKALKEGAELRFHPFTGEGRLVNQIQGGMTVEQLLAGEHSQVKLKLTGERQGRKEGILTVTAFTGRDTFEKPMRRNVDFPIVFHRPFPSETVIKSVVVNIRKVAGKFRYSVTFTCRAPENGEPASGMAAAGVNLGWKQVHGGLRVATAVYSDRSTPVHLVLPTEWTDKMKHVRDLQGQLDVLDNDMFVLLKDALKEMPLHEDGVLIEDFPERAHRLASRVRRAPRTPTRAMESLAWMMLEEPNIPYIRNVAQSLETWRKRHKRIFQEMANLRDKLIARRSDLYRVFAKQLADRVGYAVLDDTSYKQAAMLKHENGDENELHQIARSNRVLAAPYELRLSIEQALQKRGGKTERHGGSINHCHACGSAVAQQEDGVMRSCQCGEIFDVDENAARNLLKSVDGPAA